MSAAPPTPNGDLHVGHLSGPYTAGDVHTRYLRLRGVDAHFIFGTDDNQSYAKTNAVRLGLGPAGGGRPHGRATSRRRSTRRRSSWRNSCGPTAPRTTCG